MATPTIPAQADAAKDQLRDRLAKEFGLSKAEIPIALVVARGLNLRHASRELNRPYETTRTQLKSILLKTYTRRQSALAVLIVRMELEETI
jgi:DNA-binding CsgD family transcriptional regulator